MTTKKLNIKVDQKGAKKAEAEQQKLGKTIAKTIGQYVALGASVRMVGGFLIDSLKLYAQQELAEKKLTTALGYRSDALIKQAAALQKNSVYGDETIIEAQALIAAFVKEEDQIKAATKATLDLAAAKGFDLKSAADLVSKTLGSSTNALTRYGIEVKGAVGSTERLRSLTENLGKAFGGQALEQSKTLSGRMSQLSNAYGDMKENLAGYLDEHLKLTQAFKTWSDFFAGETNIFGEREWSGSASTFKEFSDSAANQAKVVAELETAYQDFRKERLKTIADQQQLLEFEQRLNQEFAVSVDLAKRPKVSPMAVIVNDMKAINEIDITKSLRSADNAVSNIAASITQRYRNIANMTSSLIGDSMVAAFTRGESAAQAFVDAFKRMLLNLATQTAVFGLINLFSGGVFGKVTGGLAGFLGFGGGRALGGAVEPGKYYKVNENTPNSEYFTPRMPGSIVPAEGMGTTVNITFTGNITDQRYVDEFILPRINRTLRLAR